ncbi:hypothetical protein C439_18518 [Haloferax mediterranei ATCC 33500]|nr:hypothetical protein C439_18518 [Haloferax mediterranei ATCC 33500]
MTDTDDTTDTDETTGTDETDTSDGTQPAHSPELSLANVDKAADAPIEHSIEVTKAATTDEHPPQVRVTLTNTSDEAVQAGEGRDIFFKYITDDSDELILLPAGSEYSADPGCWRLKESLFLTQEYQMISLDPGESRSELVDLYGAAKQEGEEETCLSVGEFSFESNFSVGASEADEKQEAKCRFSISLE